VGVMARRLRIEAELDGLSNTLRSPYNLTPLERLHMIQEKNDLQRQLDAYDAAEARADKEVEQAFVRVAAEYAEAHGLSVNEFREFGVPFHVLQRAGF
jgi:phytoene/squalene synthetase